MRCGMRIDCPISANHVEVGGTAYLDCQIDNFISMILDAERITIGTAEAAQASKRARKDWGDGAADGGFSFC